MIEPTSAVRFVAFVDILGFKNVVRKSSSDDNLRRELISALHKVRDAAPLPGQQSNVGDLRAQTFSDSIILSTHDSSDGLWSLVLTLKRLFLDLGQVGIWIRGAITRNTIYHDPDLVFGEGVNEAYELESVIAQSPRLMLSNSAVTSAISFARKNALSESLRDNLLRRDAKDGVVFVNSLHDYVIANSIKASDYVKHPKTQSLLEEAGSFRNKLQYQLDRATDQPRVFEKLNWLAQYWNAVMIGDKNEGNLLLPGVRTPGEEPSIRALSFRSF